MTIRNVTERRPQGIGRDARKLISRLESRPSLTAIAAGHCTQAPPSYKDLLNMPTLHVKVVPGSSRNRIVGRYSDGIKVQVSASPEKGKANQAVIDLLAQWLEIRANQLELVSGHAQPRKIFRITGIENSSLAQKLSDLE